MRGIKIQFMLFTLLIFMHIRLFTFHARKIITIAKRNWKKYYNWSKQFPSKFVSVSLIGPHVHLLRIGYKSISGRTLRTTDLILLR
jgi:hypothetical protein